jgi:hypothetical protein
MRFSILIMMLVVISSCNLKKITKIRFQNNNAYASAITIIANNITHKIGPIAGGEKTESVMDWTDIEKVDGFFIIQVNDAKGNIIQSYNHGAFEKGELYNHIDLEVKGIEVQVKIMN